MIQTESLNELYKGGKVILSYARCERDGNVEMVYLWVLQSALKYKRSLCRQSLYGKGFPISFSTTQKFNNQRSTESETVGVDDFIPGIIWMRNLFKAQDYGITANIGCQDNRSELIL